MKPFDTKGEYTPEEVKAALAGVSGTRQMSYRYERLDKNNNFIEDIDYVQSCTIENNALADIKRTAKMDILDTGTINYLQDRIKPYVRVAMPPATDRPYKDIISDLTPDVWYKMDDPTQTYTSMASTSVPADTTFSTFATARVYSENTSTSPVIYSTAGAVRTEFWARFNVVAGSYPVRLSVHSGGNGGIVEVWEQPGATQADLVPVPQRYTNYWTLEQAYPVTKTYYIRLSGYTSNTTASVYWARPTRVEDSSGNNYHGTGSSIGYQQPPVLNDGGKSLRPVAPITNYADTISISSGKFAGSMWYVNDDITLDRDVSSYCDLSFPGAGEMSLTINGSLNRVRLYGASNWYTGIIFWDLFPPASVINNIRHVAWSVDFMTQDANFWVNGVHYPMGTPTTINGTVDFTGNVINQLEVGGYTNVGDVSFIDDTSIFYNRTLTTADVKEMYASGISENTARSGYVEWPQGVFVLSSPSRTMVDGNHVIRKVEGYDQLVVLREDSFDYRYTVKQDVKYTDAVKNVLQTTVAAVPYPLTSSKWRTTTGSSITSDDSLSLVANNSIAQLYGSDGALVISGATAKAKVVVPATGNTITHMMFSIAVPSGNSVAYKDYYMAVDSAYNLSFRDEDAWINIPYNSTTHAYWRLREQDRYFYWETSPDGVTWTTQRAAVIPYDTNLPAKFGIWNWNSGSATATITGFSLSAARPVEMEIIKSDAELLTSMEWEPGTPKLEIVNDLLGAINYASAAYSEDGIFIGKPYVSPQDRASEFRYATDGESVLTGDIDQTVDLFGIPNKWVLVVSDPEREAIVGTYVNSEPLSPTSTVSRGRTIVDYRTEQSAADQATLSAQAARLAFEASQVYEVIEFATALMPIHSNADVYELIVDGLSVNNKYAEHSWTMNLSNGSPMTHKVRKVISV